jgi:hypothetical protein
MRIINRKEKWPRKKIKKGRNPEESDAYGRVMNPPPST